MVDTNNLLLQDICNYNQQMIFVAGDLLSTQQINDLFTSTFLKFKVRNSSNYYSLNPDRKEKLLSYFYNILDYTLLNPQEDFENHITFNECCIFHAIDVLYKSGHKTFSPESLSKYIMQITNLTNFFSNRQYVAAIDKIVKKYGKIKNICPSFSHSISQKPPSDIHLCFFCAKISFEIKKETVINYMLFESPNLLPYKQDIDYYVEFIHYQ